MKEVPIDVMRDMKRKIKALYDGADSNMAESIRLKTISDTKRELAVSLENMTDSWLKMFPDTAKE